MRFHGYRWGYCFAFLTLAMPLACASAGPDEGKRMSLVAGAPTTASTTAEAKSATAPTSAPATTQPAKLPHISIDAAKREVRVDAEMLGVDAPLEFFCVQNGTNEHESVLRSPVKASQMHLAMLIVGLQPGKPLTYVEATKKWLPPQGPPLHIDVEWTDKDGKLQTVPAYRCMRDLKTKKEMPPLTWVFTGSRVMEDGNYAADVTGYLVSVVNFDLTVIDIPELASSSNDLLEWERNTDVAPPPGTKVTMVIRPAGEIVVPSTGPATKASVGTSDISRKSTATGADASVIAPPAPGLTGVAVNRVLVDDLEQRWQAAVAPHKDELRVAAQTHYEVIAALREEQQRIIDEADKVQRLIDQLETQYRDITTPRPPAITTEK